MTFNPNDASARNGRLYGLECTRENSSVIVLPVPWEATVSFHAGTVLGPEAVLDASYQVDLHHPFAEDPWKKGIFMEAINEGWKDKSRKMRELASYVISHLEKGGLPDEPEAAQWILSVNEASAALNDWVKSQAAGILSSGKKPCLLGGDHSTPLGLYQALAEVHSSFGILQIDAHADLRSAFEGFAFSHASIMQNALALPAITQLVQAGVRDICQEEIDAIENSDGRVSVFYDWDLKSGLFNGKSWDRLCDEIIAQLPGRVHISFDIDGLDPSLCPNTGTPVPGGLMFDQLIHLLSKLHYSGKEIISFDLVEVGNDQSGLNWDGNVGARVLYLLTGLL